MGNINMGDILVAFIGAMSVPSAITGIIAWKFKKDYDKKEKEKEKRSEAQQELMLILVQSTRASIALGEATANALKRGHTNGDTEKALEYATSVKHQQKDFLARQGIHAILDE